MRMTSLGHAYGATPLSRSARLVVAIASCWRVGFPCADPPPFGISPCGCVGAGPPSGSLSRVALAFMGSHAAPSGGSPDDWATQGRTRGKARGSARAGAPADSQFALHRIPSAAPEGTSHQTRGGRGSRLAASRRPCPCCRVSITILPISLPSLLAWPDTGDSCTTMFVCVV